MRERVRSSLGAIGAPLGLMARWVARPWQVSEEPAERYFPRTADGWVLSLYRVRRSERPARGPLLFVHGLASSHLSFLFPDRSLAGYLADAGFDCWIVNLRGRGEYDGRPQRSPVRWDTDHYLDEDLPAVIRTVLSESGAERIQWIGHSMGAVLLYQYAIRHGDEQVKSGVALAGSMDYRVGENGFRHLLPLLKVIDWLPSVPVGGFYKLYAPVAGWAAPAVHRFNYHPENVEPRLARRYYASVYHDLSPGVLFSLATSFSEVGFHDRGGSLRYLEHLDRFRVPLLAIGGDLDRQCPPESVSETVRRVGSPHKRVVIAGPDEGFRSSYGHHDLLVGRAAPAEVWPLVRGFIEEWC